MEDIHLKSRNKKKITPLRQQAKLMFLTPDLFPFSQEIFYFFPFLPSRLETLVDRRLTDDPN